MPFSGLGVHDGNTGIQITPYLFVKRCFMLSLDFTPDGCTFDGQSSLPENGYIRIEFKFNEAFAEVVTALLYQEFQTSIQIDRL